MDGPDADARRPLDAPAQLAGVAVDLAVRQRYFGPRGFTAAANRDTWTTPKDLRPGKYTCFCGVHPFMRGAFEVKKGK